MTCAGTVSRCQTPEHQETSIDEVYVRMYLRPLSNESRRIDADTRMEWPGCCASGSVDEPPATHRQARWRANRVATASSFCSRLSNGRFIVQGIGRPWRSNVPARMRTGHTR
jgi:hypothetical protein